MAVVRRESPALGPAASPDLPTLRRRQRQGLIAMSDFQDDELLSAATPSGFRRTRGHPGRTEAAGPTSGHDGKQHPT